jgi:hypothetical protein
MTYFVTLRVPSPRTDHSLRHSTTRVGLQDRRVRILFFRENISFGRFSHGFRHPGQFSGNLPDCHKILVDDILWGFDCYLDHRVHVPGLLRVILLPFLTNNYYLNGRKMTYFVTLTVPSPRTDHSLRHSTTRVGLRARRVRILLFRENVCFGRFSWAYIAHGFRHTGQFFGNLPDCHKILVDDIFMRFRLIFGP